MVGGSLHEAARADPILWILPPGRSQIDHNVFSAMFAAGGRWVFTLAASF